MRASRSLGRVQHERAVQRVGDAVDVVRVHAQRLAPSSPRRRPAARGRARPARRPGTRRTPSRRGSCRRAAASRARRRVAVERREPFGVDRAMEVVDRRPARACRSGRSRAPTSSSIWRFRRWYSGTSPRLGTAIWRSTTRPAVLGVLLEQALEREDPLGDALRVVEPVDAEHDPLAAALGRRRLARALLERRVVDAERERADRDGALAVLDAPALAIDALAEQALDAVEEVRHVARRVEADRSHASRPRSSSRSHGQHAEHVVAAGTARGGTARCARRAAARAGGSAQRSRW